MKNNSKKKWWIGIGVILFILISASYYYLTRQKAIIVDGLSERGEAYVRSQMKNEKSEWRFKNLSDENEEIVTEPQNQKKVITTECFQVTVPFLMIKSNVRDNCTLDIAVADPRGRFVVMQTEVGANNIGEVDQVIMRRGEAEKYDEIVEIRNGREFIIFSTKQDLYERVAVTYFDKKALTVSWTTANSENHDSVFLTILDSLVIE